MQPTVFRFPDICGKAIYSASVTGRTQTKTSFLANVMGSFRFDPIRMETPHALLVYQLFSGKTHNKEYLYGHTQKGKGKDNGAKDN